MIRPLYEKCVCLTRPQRKDWRYVFTLCKVLLITCAFYRIHGVEDDPPIAPGEPVVDASLEPGMVPASDKEGSTEWYDEEAAERLKRKLAAEHLNPLG